MTKTRKERIAKLKADVQALDKEARRIATELALIHEELTAEGVDPHTSDADLIDMGFGHTKKVVGFRLMRTAAEEIDEAKKGLENAALAVAPLIPFD